MIVILFLGINKKEEKIYIYKVEPLLLLDVSDDVISNILNVYNQLLRECNFNFQILISNEKLNIDMYINDFYSQINEVPEIIYINYIEDLKTKLHEEKVYITKYFIVISEGTKEKSKINEYEKTIYKLEEIGCKISRINKLEDYEKILYHFINKV